MPIPTRPLTLREFIEDRITKLKALRQHVGKGPGVAGPNDQTVRTQAIELMFGGDKPTERFLEFCIDTLEAELNEIDHKPWMN